MTREDHIKHLEECAARASLSPEIQPAPKPSPLTIEINEELFLWVYRDKRRIIFTVQHKEEVETCVSIKPDGKFYSANALVLTYSQLNEILRVREALGWNGKE